MKIDIVETLDYANSSDASEIDRGIRDAINGIRISILAMGLGLAKIKTGGLYRNLNCRSMYDYIELLSAETKMYRGSIYNWLYIGEAYMKYRYDLEQVGFDDSDGPSKLPFLDRALEGNQKQEVFSNIKNMSVREFVKYSKTGREMVIPGATGDDPSAGNAAGLPVITERGNNFYIDDNLAVVVSKKLGRGTSSYLKKVIRVACEALKEGEVIQPIRLRDLKEARRFSIAAERLKIRMRTKKRGVSSQ